MKMTGTGNDVTYSLALGTGGAYAAPFYTAVGALAGKTGAAWVKAAFANAQVGQKVTVRQ